MALNSEIVNKKAQQVGLRLVGEYEPNEKITVQCHSGHIFQLFTHQLGKATCGECKKEKYSIQIRKEIESKGYTLINEYVNLSTTLILKCPNGHSRSCKLNAFRQFDCEECASEVKMKNLLEKVVSKGYTIVSVPNNTHGQLEAYCHKGHYRKAKIFNFINHECSQCSSNRNYQYTYEEVLREFENRGFKLLAKTYKNCKAKLTYMCSCGEIGETTFDTVMNSEKYSCEKCKGIYIAEYKKGENNHFWKGGLSNVREYLRNHLTSWKKESMAKSGYKCIITNNPFNAIHHLYSFNLIFDEIVNTVDFEIKADVSEHTEEELTELVRLSEELHSKYGLGICLADEVHKHFHSLYGRGYNDQWQFISFTEDYYPEALYKVEEYISSNSRK